ncbi:hypothetical protein GCM10011494_05270 [Novosphingobium endophyticum]|uniref:Uncharacterized protein n=1 Tax=Novosphingobium endophyticum TaxID=1955250 RepID=A0A916TQ68_9SPHN|nr:hypothetical protein [Novosphingobium endophyticum]GGB89859.1 hypothetical protein GCM10011494_05270 [Novosphingobium endophyticum]
MSISLNRPCASSLNCDANRAGKIATILALVLALPAQAAAAEAAPAAAGKASEAKPDLFAQQAGQLRANACAGLYSALGNGAVAGSTYTLRTEADPAAPDAHTVQGTVGMTYNLPDAKGQAAALVSAAPVGNRCEGQFVRVVPFQTGCSQVLRDFPEGSRPIGNLSGVPLYQLGGNGGQVLTIPSGETCVVISIVQGQQQL